MKLKILIPFVFVIIGLQSSCNSQELPYHQIPDAPENFEAGNVLSRVIDGLGYRYYWATEGLTEENLNYVPKGDTRSMLGTLEHIHGMSNGILKTVKAEPIIRNEDKKAISFEEIRAETLKNLKAASDYVRGKDEDDLAKMEIIFQRGENKRSFPLWNLLNGQLSDCIYHTGQIVSFRRSSGNPINPEVNVFMGKTGS